MKIKEQNEQRMVVVHGPLNLNNTIMDRVSQSMVVDKREFIFFHVRISIPFSSVDAVNLTYEELFQAGTVKQDRM